MCEHAPTVSADPESPESGRRRRVRPAGVPSASPTPRLLLLAKRDRRSSLPRHHPVGTGQAAPERLTLSVVVPASDRPATVPRCLAAIAAAVPAPDEVLLVETHRGRGPAAARNEGARQARGDVLVFVDSDVEVHKNAFGLLAARLEANVSLTGVFGSYDCEPKERDVVSTFRNLLHHHVHQQSTGPVSSFWAGLGAVRRDAFWAVDGFDERFETPSIEDLELGARLVAAGAQIELDGAVQGKHLKRWTVRSMVETDLLRRGMPWARLALEGRAPRCGLNLAWRHRFSALASIGLLVSLVRRRDQHFFAAGVAMWILNRRFYALLRTRGQRVAIIGFALHVLHHFTAAIALVAALAQAAGATVRGAARR
jgi:glycosyltransferase involved in cell wall biosynthesis